MEQKTIDNIAKGIKIFGVVLFTVGLGFFIWSLTRPPVTTGPVLPDPFQQQSR